jgi:hypothetical protein
VGEHRDFVSASLNVIPPLTQRATPRLRRAT